MSALHPNAATGAEAATAGGRTGNLYLLGDDATNVPAVEDLQHDASRAYAATPAALADRYLLSKIDPEFFPFLLYLITVCTIAGIDDWRGNLDNGPALQHFLWKCAALAAVAAVVLIVWQIYKWLRSKLG